MQLENMKENEAEEKFQNRKMLNQNFFFFFSCDKCIFIFLMTIYTYT